jgi:N-acetylmuramoyl-L-alanine amidase
VEDGGATPDSHVPVESDAEFRVIIDPGHGGRDTGSRTGIGQEEKEQTLKIAQRIRDLLAAEKGLAVYLTRNSDRDMATAERINFANKLRGHVYISIHFNWSPSQRSKGYRIYVNSNRVRLGTGFDLGADMFSKEKPPATGPPEMKRFLSHSKRLAKELAKQLKNSGLTGEQDKEVFLAGMDNLSMPGVLVEVLYFSNRDDQIILSSPAFINSVSRAFCDSILVVRNILRDENAL